MAMNDWTKKLVPCKSCGKLIEAIDVFPKGRCMECHAAVLDKLPDVFPRPDFTNIFNQPKRRKS